MKKWLLGFLMLFIVTACSNEQNDAASTTSVSLEPISVEIILPESIEPNQETTIKTVVMQGEEFVNDASEVVFEIWKEGKAHRDITAEFVNDGVYAIDITFEEKGIYHVISHVTARQMHNMPQQKFTVGDVEITESVKQDQDELLIHLTVEEKLVAGVPVNLITFLQKGEDEVVGALVEYAIINEAGETLTYVTASESAPGQYTGETTFPVSGAYDVAIHVRKDELREHVKEQLEVIEK